MPVRRSSIRASSRMRRPGRIRSTPISTRPSLPAACSACRCTAAGSPSARPTPFRWRKRRSPARSAELQMSGSRRVFSIPPGAPFLPTLARGAACRPARARLPLRRRPAGAGRRHHLRADAPRRACVARRLRRQPCRHGGGGSAILPVIRPLGEFDEDEAAFEADASAAIDLAPPIAATERLLLLAPLVRAWKRSLPAHVAALFDEEIVVPASAADAIWLARDLARLMDEIETEGTDWTRLTDLVTGNLAGWWQVTLEFPRHRHRRLAEIPRGARPLQPGRASQRADPAARRRG